MRSLLAAILAVLLLAGCGIPRDPETEGRPRRPHGQGADGGHSRPDPLPLWIKNQLMLMDWVKDAEVRLREAGHVFTGEAFVVPIDDQDLVGRIERANRQLLDLDWRLHELVIAPVHEIERPEPAGDGS